MRTTLNIDEDVLLAAKELARRQRKTAGKVLSELARRALQERPQSAENSRGEEAVLGFVPFEGGVPVTDSDVEALREQEGV